MTSDVPKEHRKASSAEHRSADSQAATPRDNGETVSSDGPETMGEISHVHPFADRGAMTRVFSRGRIVADGGEHESNDEETKTMADIEHEAPAGAGDSAGVFERGHEFRVQYR
ncbi:hypothetical protein BG842_18610 [Haladaptatus sp. W1]|uniref:hypothetical protein n=1 Tax=Haladaptatus sp. W1 TaxID=1897478 RepID=UPI0008499ADD|nr:hypothetical protein [Haladaptatus sp. W1]ODR83428.1 hypothetical protein BG842_18610 [Haladaptatus sp. W1]